MPAAQEAGAPTTHLLIVAGLGGSDDFRARFLEWSLALRQAAVERYGLGPEHVTVLAEDPSMDAAVAARSTRDEVAAALTAIAGRATPADRVLLVLLGHGSFRDAEARFNLPGPDLTPAELAAMLDALPARHVAVVNAASASGPFVPALAAAGRTVIAATKTGQERNETRFGEFFARAFEGEGADLDKNGSVSLLEAFRFARSETARSYEEESLLMTEHAVLDDDGDGEGAEDPSADAPDGAGAAAFVLGTPGRRASAGAAAGAEPRPVPTDSALARLYRERAELEGRVAELRRRRSELEAAEYDRRLEELLLELALKTREIRDREGGGA